MLIGIDFFCGAGGATKGFQNAGIKIIAGIDIDSTCEKTYNNNCHPAKFLLGDLNVVQPADILKAQDSHDRLVFIACAPCQPFSRSNKNKKTSDKRKGLILRFFDFVANFKPDALFIENVPGFELAEGGRFLQSLINGLGYEVSFKRVNAKIYGVPQNRSRFIMLASRHGKINFPPPTHGKGLAKFITVADAISKYPPISAGNDAKSAVANHVCRRISEINMRRLLSTPVDGGSRTSWPPELWLKCHKKTKAGHSDVYGRMSWDKPAPTLTCKCNSISNGRFGHPSQDRGISLREAATLQTFSDDFIFYGNQTSIARQIGNAVPPLLAKIFAQQIRNHLATN